jgi:tetratricopeptide (TPR) repeat protein
MSGNIFKKVLKHGIKSLNAPKYTNDGISLVKQNRLKEAEYAYLQAIEADPNYAQAYFCLGHLLEGQNRLREAEQAYHKAIESGQDNDQIAQVYTNLGALLENQNRLTEAENAYCE